VEEQEPDATDIITTAITPALTDAILQKERILFWGSETWKPATDRTPTVWAGVVRRETGKMNLIGSPENLKNKISP